MSTLQTGDEDSPELTEENEDIEVVETPLRMEQSMLESPLPFNVDAADLYCERRNWVNTFDLYVLASELTKKDDLFQRATLLYCLGPAVQIIFNTLPGGHETLDETKEALENYFAPKRNVVSERCKFRSRGQRLDEAIDTYLTALRELAKTCDFGA